MPRKNDKCTGRGKQLDLPFKSIDNSKSSESPTSNIISFTSKIKETNINQELEIRKKCIDNLLKDADKLKW